MLYYLIEPEKKTRHDMEQSKLVNKSLSVQVADELEQRIASGEWPLGSRIPSESELMALFGVSRNTLREAIRYLSIAGVVDVRPGDGTYILTKTVFNASLQKRVEKEDVVHVLETRGILEPPLVEMAAQRRSAQELETLRDYYQNMLDSYQQQRPDYIDNDIKFHLQISRMCHNPLLTDLYRAIANFLPQFLEKGFYTFAFGDLDLFLHKDLFDCIVRGDGATARRLTERMVAQEVETLREAGVI